MKKLLSVLILPVVVAAFTFAPGSTAVGEPAKAKAAKTTAAKTVAEKSKTFGRRGPELYIENLPSTSELLPAPQPRSLPAFDQGGGAARGRGTEGSPSVGGAWTAIGPFPIPNGQTEPFVIPNPRRDPVSGRVTAIDIHPTNPDIAYVGTAQGGLYRTLNGGGTWLPLMDNAPATFVGTPLAIGAVTISPTSASTVFVGTGEGNLSGDSFFGSGFYIITNADSFNPIVNGPYNANAAGGDVFSGRSIVSIAVHPTNPNIMFLSTSSGIGGIRSSAFSVRPARGLYRTMNALAGVNGLGTPVFERLQVTGTTSTDTISTSVVIEPGNPNNVYVGFLGQAAADPAGIFRTADALAPVPTFTLAKSTPLGAGGGNSKLAISKAGGIVTVYATTSEGSPQGQLFRSDNNGPFVQLAAANGFAGQQGFYDIAVGVNPNNPSNVSIGGNVGGNIHRVSNDGGATLPASVVSLHPDTHAITYSRSNPRVIYHGDDGGVWRSNDGGASWINLNNSSFSATQFSDIATHPTDRNYTLAGTQDNGTNLLRPDGTWFRVDFGDGGYSLIDRNVVGTENVLMYHTYFNQRLNLIATARTTTVPCAQEGSWSFRGIAGGAADPTPGCDGEPSEIFNGMLITDNVNFYAPMVLGPGNPSTWYFGTDKLYRSTNRADTATMASQLLDQTAAGTPPTGTPVSSIAISPQDDNVRLVGLNNGKVYATTLGSATLLQIAGPGATNGPVNTPATANVTSGATIGANRIAIDPHNKNIAYIAFGGYGTQAAPIAHVYKTTNLNALDTAGTVVLTPTSIGLPDLPHNALAIDPQSGSPGTPCTDIYAGTDRGVYASLDGGATWNIFGTGFPHVSVFGLEIQNQSRVIRAATHGRGMYENFVARQPDIPLVSEVVSRRTHGSAGTFEINMLNSGVESRTGGTYNIVVAFTSSVVSGAADVTSGNANEGAVTFAGNEMMIPVTLTNPDPNGGQTVTLNISNVNDANGGAPLASQNITLRFLIGDVNNDSFTNGGDALIARNHSGKQIDGTNYRSDVNADGFINGGDAIIVRSKSGTGFAPQPSGAKTAKK